MAAPCPPAAVDRHASRKRFEKNEPPFTTSRAMKVKVKLDSATIKAWLLAHGEKVAFALVMIGVVAFIVGAAREVLDAAKQPENLKALALDVGNHIQNSKFDAKKLNLDVVDYSKRTNREEINVANFVLTVPFNQPLFDDKAKREDPALFNVEELRVTSGIGTFALVGGEPSAQGNIAAKSPSAPPTGGAPAPKAGGGNNAVGGFRGLNKLAPGMGARSRTVTADPQQSRWGVKPSSTAKLKLQPWAVVTGLVPVEKQSKEFSRCFDNAVGGDAVRDKLRYSGYILQRAEINDSAPDNLDWKDVKYIRFEEDWEKNAGEVVEQEYALPNLTGKLGPLVGVSWGESVAHPKIPVMWHKTAEPEPAAAPDADKPKEEPKEESADGPKGHKFGSVESTPTTQTAPAALTTQAPPSVPYRLLRIFDYTVEVGKRYRYQIKLYVHNPNYKLPERDLKNPASRSQEDLLTPEWSGPTNIVSIPPPFGVLAGGVKPPKGPEPAKAKLLVTGIDPGNGFEATTERDYERGAVANLKESNVKARDPRTEQVTSLKEFDFKTNIVVLDIYGGKPLKPRSSVSSPAEILLLDANGNLSVHGELQDHEVYMHAKPPEEAEARVTDKSDRVDGDDPKKGRRPTR